MKRTFARRYYRRHSPSKSETSFFKQESQESFFGGAEREAFFHPAATASPSNGIQRKCEKCAEEDKKVHRKEDKKEEDKKIMRVEEKKEDDKKVMRAVDKKEEEKIQRQPEKKEEEKLHKKETGSASTSATGVSSYVSSLSGKGNALPAGVNYFFSSGMGYDFGNVKVHTDKDAAQSAKSVNAKAYTIGNHIVFNEGQFDPGSGEGKKLMAHELAHVMQENENSLNRKTELEEKDQPGKPTFSSREFIYKNTRHFANCNGVTVHGQTDANYGNSFTSSGTSKHGGTCENCSDDDCITNKGTIDSTFTASPTVTLPAVPEGLNECEKQVVQTFIDTTLNAHEQQHVAAFNTYAGTVKTKYTYKGCADGLDAFTQQKHDEVEATRKASADTKSADLDKGGKNNFKVECNCP